MPPQPEPRPPGTPAPRARGPLLAFALGLAGVLMMHHPMILAGMGAIQTDLGDSRLILAILEHTYLWVGQTSTHQDLWSPPFFYPATNAGAYSDILLTVAPIYWLGRVAGLEADSAFQGWMMAVSALNYGAALALLRRAYRFTWSGAAIGAFLVAFAAPRANQLQHQQLMPTFFGVMTLFALARLLDEPRPGRVLRWAWWQVASWGVVAQLYAGFYNGWFLILGLGIVVAWGLALPGTRGRVLGIAWRDALPMMAAAVAGGLALTPFLTHYLAAARELGERDYAFVRLSLLRPWSWLDMGPGHWLAGWTAGAKVFGNDFLANERHVGLGLVTPAVCATGWWMGRHRPLIRVAAPAALTLALLTTKLTPEGEALWHLIYNYVPGGRAVRAVGRVGLTLLVPAALGAAAFFGSPWAARRPVRAGLIGLACLAEQGVTTTTFDKAAERGRIAYLARFVDPAASAFYYRPVIASAHIYQLDAMMMSLRTGVPTVNGYSGGWPRAWHPLLQADTPGGPTARGALAEWLKVNGMTPDQVQAIGDGLDRRFAPPPPPAAPPR